MKTMARMTVIAGALAVVLSACSQTPVPSTYWMTWQDKMQAAQHWDVLAEDVAEDLGTFMASGIHAGRAVHVAPDADATAFGIAFHRLLEGHLLDAGLPVTRDPNQGIVVGYEVLGIEHGSEGRDITLPPGLLSLAGGVTVLARSGLDTGPMSAAIGGGAVLADLLAGTVALRTSTEILFTASIYQDDLLLYRMSRIYYVPEGDTTLYAAVNDAEDETNTLVLNQKTGQKPHDVLADAESRCQSNGRIALLRGVEKTQEGTAMRFDCVDDPVLLIAR